MYIYIRNGGAGAGRDRRRGPLSGYKTPPETVYFTSCISELVLESQLPHKIFNLLFTITNCDMRLTVLWGGQLLQNDFIHTF